MTATIPVRSGPFQYVLVRPDGTTTTLPVDPEVARGGRLDVDVTEGDRVLEIALASTSDPDLDPARGQVWP